MSALHQAFTPLSAFAFLVFVLLYVPCLATVGAQIQEFGWQWTALSIVIMLVDPVDTGDARLPGRPATGLG